jgi:hypothetical protein
MEFPIWKTISLGGYPQKLVKVGPRELGFKGRATFGAVYERTDRLGLRETGDGVALEIRHEYEDQPIGESIVVVASPRTRFSQNASCTLMYWDGLYRIFRLEDGRRLVDDRYSLWSEQWLYPTMEEANKNGDYHGRPFIFAIKD